MICSRIWCSSSSSQSAGTISAGGAILASDTLVFFRIDLGAGAREAEATSGDPDAAGGSVLKHVASC